RIKLGGQESCAADWAEADDRHLLSTGEGMTRLANVQWKSFLSRFRSYSVTRYRPTSLVLTFGRRSDGQPEARREDYRSSLDVVSPPGAQAVECRAETSV